MIEQEQQYYLNFETTLAKLLLDKVVFIRESCERDGYCNGDVSLYVSCNDVFAWGCCDSQPLPYHDIEDVYKFWLRDNNLGPVVWCCMMRNEMPQKPVADKIRASEKFDIDALGLKENRYDKKQGIK